MRFGVPFAVGCAMIVSSAIVQALAIAMVVRIVRPQLTRRDAPHDLFRAVGVFLQALLLTLAAQLVQIAAWAVLFVGLGEFADFATAFYHSAVNFATLGYGDITMSPQWRLLGPFEAIAGMLMFGIATAGLFAIVQALIDGLQPSGDQD
jgi:hypothetical protein